MLLIIPRTLGMPNIDATFNETFPLSQPFCLTSKCKCEPYEFPVFPSIPIAVPIFILVSALTRTTSFPEGL